MIPRCLRIFNRSLAPRTIMSEICHNCGEEYKRVTMHWRRSECPYPSITTRQHEVIKGCLMGDGHLSTHNKSPIFHVSNTNIEFLEWVSDKLGILVSKCGLHETAEQKQKNMERGNMDGWGEKDMYRLSTRTLPTLERYKHWYPDGEIQFPDDLELTPLSLKMWYCCDGSLTQDNQIHIGSKNEMHREAYLKSLFSKFNVEPTITNWTIHFTIDGSEHLFELMGDPPSGMQYKWGEYS